MKAARLAAALLALAMVAPATSPAGQDVQAGFVVTIDAPSSYTPGVALPVSGQLLAVARVPIVLEFAHGIADEEIELVVNGDVVATTTTAEDGSYRFDLQIDHTPPPQRTIFTRAFAASLLETNSRTIVASSSRYLADLRITPEQVALEPDASAQLLAEAAYDDGRPAEDVTDQVTWSSSDAGVAAISDADGLEGVVTAVGEGTATITAVFYGRAATATVVVG